MKYRIGHLLGRRKVTVAVVSALAMVAAACGGAGGSHGPKDLNSGQADQGQRVTGGTVTWAEWPGQPPDYIFPLFSYQYYSQPNVGNFQYLMYRPLYWFGTNDNRPLVDESLSLAYAPVWSDNDTVVTIRLKPYEWSDGETVSSRDVVLWMNLLKANTSNWGAYVPGYFPDNVVSTTAESQDTVVFKLNRSYNQTWFLYNELSQITPLPIAWDRTSLGGPVPQAGQPNLPDTTSKGARDVYSFLDRLSKNTGSWVGSPIWSVVDGPFKLEGFTNTGEVTFVPNPSYSGPVKPSIARFIETPITSPAAEVSLARGGSSNLTVAYLPDSYMPELASLRSAGYRSISAYTFDSAYMPFNLNNPKFGPVFRQLYFRQAFQHLVDQPGWIEAFYGGDAVPTYGPVPIVPSNPFADNLELHQNPYPFSVAAAAQLLRSHGWDVRPGGVTTCRTPGSGPGECGTGVPAGLQLSLNLDYVTNSAPLASAMLDLKTQASKVGIQLQLTTHPYSTVATVTVPCQPTQPSCGWTLENWQVGWIYGPDYYPTGEELFKTGAAVNFSNYNDPEANKLIDNTITAPPSQSQAVLGAYQDYLAENLPVVWEPVGAGNPIAGGLTLVSKRLGGYTTNSFGSINPEYWYFVKS